jgi:hypothetical protein
MKYVKFAATTPRVHNPDTFSDNKGIKIALNLGEVQLAYASDKKEEVFEEILEAIMKLNLSSTEAEEFKDEPPKPKRVISGFKLVAKYYKEVATIPMHRRMGVARMTSQYLLKRFNR